MVLILLALAGGLEACCDCTVLIANKESFCVCSAIICNLIFVALISPTVCKSTKWSGISNKKLSCVIPIDRSKTCRRNLFPPYTVDNNKPPSGNTKLQASLKPQVSAMSTQIVEDQTTWLNSRLQQHPSCSS
jgi:hypothetical protein